MAKMVEFNSIFVFLFSWDYLIAFIVHLLLLSIRDDVNSKKNICLLLHKSGEKY